MAEEAGLNVVIDGSKAEDGAKVVKRSLENIKSAADQSFGSIKSMMHNLSSETELARNQLASLSKVDAFSSLEKARSSVASLKDLRATIDSLRGGYTEATSELKKFIKENGDTWPYKSKTAQKELQAMQKELEKTGKDLDSLAKQTDSAMKKGESAISRFEKSAGGSLGNVWTGMKRLLAMYLSFQTVKGFFNKLIEETTSQEAATAQLNATLTSTNYAAGLSAQAISGMSEELHNMTTYADEDILSMQDVLLTFRNIKGDSFKEASMAVLDLSAKLGGDLQSNAIKVGKALQDPIKGLTNLSRVGIQFSGEQVTMVKNLVKTGDVLGAQKIILKQLEEQYGGSAKAARDTLGGALAALKNNFNDLFEMNASDKFGKVTDSVNALADAMQSDAVQKFRKDLIDLAATGLTAVANALTSVTNLLGTLKNMARTGITIAVSMKLGGMLGTALGGAAGGAWGSLFGLPAGYLGAQGLKFLGNDVANAKNTRNQKLALESAGINPVEVAAKTGKTLAQQYQEYMKSMSGQMADRQIYNQLSSAGLKVSAPSAASDYTSSYSGGSKSKSGGSSRSSSGPSALDLMLQSIQDKMKYFNSTGEAYLPTLSKMLAKTTPLSAEWKKIKDVQLSIKDNLAKINEEQLKNAETLREQASNTVKYRKDMENQFYENAGWKNSNGLMGDTEYLDLLKERMKELVPMTDEWKKNYEAISSVSEKLGTTEITDLVKQFEDGKLKADDLKISMDQIITKYELTGDAAQKLRDIVTSAADKQKKSLYDLNELTTKWVQDLQSGLVDAIMEGESFGDTLKSVGKEMEKIALKMILFGNNGTSGILGGALSWFGKLFTNSKGNAFGPSGLMQYANGGLVTQPTLFAFGNGGSNLGIMGEAGTEAVMPLKRNSSGQLGVVNSGGIGGGTTYAPTINVKVNNTGSGNMNDDQAKQMGQMVRDAVDARVAENMYKWQRSGIYRNAFAR
jgi:hypothetical protein